MNNHAWTAIGSAAAFLTMFAFLPQIFKAVKTKSVNDVSLFTLLQMALGVFFWLLYGVHLNNYILIVANGVTLLSMVILLSLYSYYRRP
ncbi:MAG TPA: SemiSWEET family transporter [Candidatus Margulisiibacteriota bacterium]|nr:SemiSWEET family transporter [Candidatus Margulisiibacteriota bacterium]